MATADQPYREFELTRDHLDHLTCEWQWGVRVAVDAGIDDGVSWFDDEDNARDFAESNGWPVVRQQRIYWSGQWEEAPAAGLKTPSEWQCEIPDVRIMDPDGWRGSDGRPWTDPISREEYLSRRDRCTVSGPTGLRKDATR
jgi:hypothetical protein